jgi:hypothetical protein
MPRMRIALVVPVLVALASPVAAEKLEPAPPDPIADELAALKVAAKCSDKASVWRPWCIAADFETGTAAALPRGKVLVGMTIRLLKGKEVDALTNGVTFTALAVAADGKVKLAQVVPSNKDEEKMTAEALFNAAAVFKGKAKKAKLHKDLVSFLKSMKGEYATTKAGKEWTWPGPAGSKLRKVGAFWVAIEVPEQKDGVMATILTADWE